MLPRSVYTESCSVLTFQTGKNMFFLQVQGRHLSGGSFSSCFQEEKERDQDDIHASAAFSVSSAQNHSYAKWHTLGWHILPAFTVGLSLHLQG